MSTLTRQSTGEPTLPSFPDAFWVRGARRYEIAKRAFDVVIAAAALLALAPVMILVAVLVKTTSPGPVVFRQHRLGRNGRRFVCYKFRTMHRDAEARFREVEAFNESAGGVLFKLKRDPRITPIGRVLRKTSLDELPQFVNVLAGDMSLVGPRPLQLRDCDLLAERDPLAARSRLRVQPGLTGLWQVSGRSGLDFTRMLELDREYVRSRSLAFDLFIILRTIKVVLSCKGAY